MRNRPAVSEIGLGTWQLGIHSGWKNMSRKEAINLVHRSIESGVNFFDTAPNYGLGTSELRLGKALRGYDRDQFVINTKFGHTVSGQRNYHADHIRPSLEQSLRRMQLEYVDSFMIHSPPMAYLDGNKNDHYEILERLKDEGKIKAYGASVDTASEMRLFINTTKGEVIEAFYNILHQDTAQAFPLAKENNVGIIVKIPLDSGWLSGKYDEHSKFNDIRQRWSRDDIKTRAYLINKLKEITGGEVNLAQIAISFCLAHEAVTTVIPGNTNIAQLKTNLDSLRHPVSADLVEKCKTFYREEVQKLHLPW